MSEQLSGLIREHVYWGSMRNRLPVSQADELVGEQASAPKREHEVASRKARVKVRGKQNLCVIRSGQDWSKTSPEERRAVSLRRCVLFSSRVWVSCGIEVGAGVL